MYARRKPVCEKTTQVPHPEYEIKETKVSDYLRKYGTGKLEDLPTSSRPEITDNRSVDQMLDDPCESMATETIDVLAEIERNRESFVKAIMDVKATAKQRKQFDDAIKVLQDENAPYERKREAYAILDDLERQGKLTRARNL